MIAIPAVGAVIAAIFALLFLLAWSQWRTTIVNTLSVDLPLIGNAISSAVAAVADRTYALIVYWFDGMLHPVAEFILRPVVAIEAVVSSVTDVGANTYNAIWSLSMIKLPAVLSQAVAYSNVIYAEALSNTQNYYNAAVSYAANLGANLLGDIQNYYNLSIAYATGIRGELIGYIQSYYNQAVAAAMAGDLAVTHVAESLYNQGIAFTRTAYSAATSYATSLAVKGEQDLAAATTALETYAETTATHAVGVLVTDIDHAITGTLEGVWDGVLDGVSGTIGALGDADADILEAIKSLDWSIPRDIAGLAALAGVTTLTLTRYLKECGIPNCRNLSNFGNELQSLLGVVNDVAFLALIAELIHNPTRAHAIVADTFGGAINTGANLAHELLGV